MNYYRKYLIENIYNVSSLLFDDDALFFESISSLKEFFTLYPSISVNLSVVKIFNVSDLQNILEIISEKKFFKIKDSLYLKLENISLDMLKVFSQLDANNFYPPLVCNANNVLKIKKLLEENFVQLEGFVNFCKKTYGIFNDNIDINNYKNIIDIYTDPFLKFPFFCMSYIKWDFNSLDKLYVNDLEEIFFKTTFVAKNFSYASVARDSNHPNFVGENNQRLGSIDWSMVGYSGYSIYQYGYFNILGKVVYIDNNLNIYIETPDFLESQINIKDFINSGYNCDKVAFFHSLYSIPSEREFDLGLKTRCCVSFYNNFIRYKSVTALSPLCKFVSRCLMGESV